MATRYKEVTCGLCGQKFGSWEPKGTETVCRNCRDLYNFGRKMANKVGADDRLVVVWLDSSHRSPSWLDGANDKDRRAKYGRIGPFGERRALGDALIDALGASIIVDVPAGMERVSEPIDVHSGNARYQPRHEALVIPANKVEAARKLYEVIGDALRAAYDEGYSAGNHLLGRLADGSVTIGEYDDLSVRRR